MNHVCVTTRPLIESRPLRTQDALSPELVCFKFQPHRHWQIHWFEVKPSDFLHLLSSHGLVMAPPAEFHTVLLISGEAFRAVLHREDAKWPVKRPDPNSFERGTGVTDFSRRLWSSCRISLKLQRLLKEITRLVWKKEKKVSEDSIAVLAWSWLNLQ